MVSFKELKKMYMQIKHMKNVVTTKTSPFPFSDLAFYHMTFIQSSTKGLKVMFTVTGIVRISANKMYCAFF